MSPQVSLHSEILPGKDNPSDYMSGHPVDTKETCRPWDVVEEYINFIVQHTTPKSISIKEIKHQMKDDATLQVVIKCIHDGKWHETQWIQT